MRQDFFRPAVDHRAAEMRTRLRKTKHNQKLTDSERCEVATRFRSGESARLLAAEYGCSADLVWLIARRPCPAVEAADASF